MTQVSENPMGTADSKKLLIKFTIPSIISMTASNLYNLADQMFIGWKVGILGNAATNAAFPLTTILLALSLAIGIGSSSRYGMELGRGNKKLAETSVGNAILLMLIAGIGLMTVTQLTLYPLLHAFGATTDVFPYAITYVRITAWGFPFFMFSNMACVLIRMDGSPRFSMLSILTGCIINVILDPVLMYGFDMGISGAAYATLFSQIISCAFCVLYFFHMKQIHLTRSAFIPDFSVILKNLSLGYTTFITQISITVIQIVLNNALVFYGARSVYGSEIPLASAGVIMKMNSIVTGLFIAISQGSQPLYSFNMGAKKYSRVETIYKQAVRMSIFISVPAFLIFEFLPKPLLMLFGTSDDLYFQFAVPFMRVFLAATILNGIQVISTNAMPACGMPWRGAVLAILRYLILSVPLILILPMYLGVDGIQYSGAIAVFHRSVFIKRVEPATANSTLFLFFTLFLFVFRRFSLHPHRFRAPVPNWE